MSKLTDILKGKSLRKGSAVLCATTALLMGAVTTGAYAQSTAGFKPLANDARGEVKKKYPPGTAWRISWPLGTHIESTVDTVLYNYQRTFITSMTSDAYATTGQLSGPAMNMIYFQRDPLSDFFFNDAITRWVPTMQKQKFYNMYIPFTQLSYNLGYGTENRTDWLKATFAGNVNRKVGIGAFVDYPYTKGNYANQAAKELAYGFSGYYLGDRYEMQALFSHYNHLNKENGGITDDLYITDPAAIQGGVNSIEPKSIPVNLSDAHNRVTGSEFYMSHAYKLGFWRDITQPADTVKREEFVASTKFVYSFDWRENHRFFISKGNSNDFWQNSWFDPHETADDAFHWSVANTLGVEMIEGFQKWAKFGISAYATYEIDKYRYAVRGLDQWRAGDEGYGKDLPEGYDPQLKKTRNRLWVGGRIQKTRGSIIRYSADARFGIVGEAAGEVDVSGELETRFRLGKDTVRISANGFFRNLEPNYMYRNYVGNHFIWHNDFGKIRSFRAEGRLYIPWSRSDIRVGVENVQNQVYFRTDGTPAQHGGSVQVFSLSLDQKLKFGIWNWDNTITYQTTSDKEVIPLPALSVYSNMYLYFKAFKALTVQFGIDCNYYTRYRGLHYQPATMAFCSPGKDGSHVGNYAFANVYLTAKLYKVRLFVMCSHVNEGWFSSNYFSLPHYPLDPREFRCGLSIDFTD